MEPLIITAAPYGPTGCRATPDIPVTWDEQVQAAVDCYNAGATVLHLHVRNPATGHLSADIEHYNYMMARLRKAVPKMIIQVGGSIAFSPKSDGARPIGWTTIRVTCSRKSTRSRRPSRSPSAPRMLDITQMWTADDIKGTHLEKIRR